MAATTPKGFPATGSFPAQSYRSSRPASVSRSAVSNASATARYKAAADTAGAITDAAVLRVGERLNVGNTGFDKGVADKVKSAVMSALKKTGDAEQAAPETAPEENGADESGAAPAAEGTKPASSTDEIRELAKRYVEIYQKQSGRDLTEEQAAQKIEDVAKFYSAPSRAGRLKTLVEASA